MPKPMPRSERSRFVRASSVALYGAMIATGRCFKASAPAALEAAGHLADALIAAGLLAAPAVERPAQPLRVVEVEPVKPE